MIDRAHQKAVYDELKKHIIGYSNADMSLFMNVFVARQLFDSDYDPQFEIDPKTEMASFCGVPIIWQIGHRIELRKGDELLYSIVWDPDPNKKAKLHTRSGTALNVSGSQAMRFNEGKLEWSLIDFKQLEGMVRVLQFGAKKYDRDNWKKGLPMRQQCESMMRHLVAIMSGEVRDKETGEYHWHCIQCNAMFMGHTYENHPQHIDIPTPNFNGK